MLKISELIKGYKEKKFSSGEILSEIFRSIKSSRLNAFLTLNEKFPEKPVIPIAVKDNIITKGIRTTAASRLLENYTPTYNATVVKRLLENSFFIVGKTNLDEFAMGSTGENSAFGPTKNPHNSDLVPGGSSSGSASAIGGDLVPLALGSDTGGSIRLPSAYCNIWGFKPSYGRVSRFGLIAFASSLDVIGPMAKNPEDITTIMSIISGRDEMDATTLKEGKVDAGKVKHLKSKIFKVAIIENMLEGVDGAVMGPFEVFIKDIERGGIKVGYEKVNYLEFSLAAYYIIASSEASSNLARYDGVRYGVREEGNTLEEVYKRTRDLFGKEVKRRIGVGSFALSYGYYDRYYLKALKARRLIKQEFDRIFKTYDLIIVPTSPSPPPKLGAGFSPIEYYNLDKLTVPFSLAGLPVMNVPLGNFMGVQIAGKYGFDEEVLAICERIWEIMA